jgi:hypothetical protein
LNPDFTIVFSADLAPPQSHSDFGLMNTRTLELPEKDLELPGFFQIWDFLKKIWNFLKKIWNFLKMILNFLDSCSCPSTLDTKKTFKALPGNDNALPGNDNALPGNDMALDLLLLGLPFNSGSPGKI